MENHVDKIVNQLFDNAHLYLTEDEIIDVTLEANLSIVETNSVIETLINKGVYVSENVQEALKKVKKDIIAEKRTIGSRKSPENATTFSMLQIPVGSELTFLKDNKIIAITQDKVNKIKLKDGSLKGSTSKLAQILAVKFCYADTAKQGPRWWLYKGKTLFEIRKNLESKGIIFEE